MAVDAELDNPERLLALIGSFWSNVYSGRDLVASLLLARAQLDVQAQLDFEELLAAMSRFTVPVHHTDNWYRLKLRESDKNQSDANLAQFNSTYTFASGIYFGVPVNTSYFVWNAPSGLADVRAISNEIVAPSVILTQGSDFYLADGAIWFRTDPFADDRITKSDEFAAGVVVDCTCTLWLYRSQWDQQTTHRQFGYVVESAGESSYVYRDFVNAIFDGLVEGTTRRSIESLFAALGDVPLARGDETVEVITSDRRGLLVITDANAYRFTAGSDAIVSVGDTVHAGNSLTDTVQIFEFNRGAVPSAEELRALVMPKAFLNVGYFDGVTFENKDVPLVVELDVNEFTKISFEVGGFPGDVELFWTQTHEAGVAAGQTLAMLLDRRTNRVGQPTAANLPATVNPMEFLIQNVLRNNAYAVVLRPQYFGANALGTHHATLVRKLVPPHTACLIATQLEVRDDVITMGGPGDDTHAGYSEIMRTFLCGSHGDTISPETYISERVRFRHIVGRCE